jgi:pimeloyl-ACP methyl ester carboxylesterase
MGGPIAQLVWHRHRDRVKALVLCATSRNFRGTRTATLLTEAMPAAWVAATVGPGGIARTANIIWNRRRDESPVVRWALAELRRSNAMSLVQAVRALSRFSSHDWISDVDIPTAVLVTMRDRLVPPQRQLKLARAIAGASVHPVQGDHFVVGTSPSLFIPAFVEAVDLVVSRLDEAS